MYMLYSGTVEHPIKDLPRRGHNRNNLSTKTTLKKSQMLISHLLIICFQPLKSGQPLYKGQNGWSQHVLCSEVPLAHCI